MKFEIYCEGFQEMECAYSPPQLIGCAEGETFHEACAEFFRQTDERRRHYSPSTNTYWGLTLGPTLKDVTA